MLLRAGEPSNTINPYGFTLQHVIDGSNELSALIISLIRGKRQRYTVTSMKKREEKPFRTQPCFAHTIAVFSRT